MNTSICGSRVRVSNKQVGVGHVLISQMLVGGPLNIRGDAFVTLVNL